MKKMNWLEKEIEFYDFIWSEGVSICSKCVNEELMEDFRNGGNSFEEMKKIIVKKFKTRKNALTEFNKIKKKHDTKNL